jgi:hypothetical protein
MCVMIKQSVMAGLLCVLAANCGGSESGPCSDSVLVGDWSNAEGSQTLSFGGSCTFSDDTCHYSGTYPNTTAENGSVAFTIDSVSSEVEPCLTVGTHQCGYEVIGGSVLTVDCGTGEFSYTKK